MTPSECNRKWAGSRLLERQCAQEHFVDLYKALGKRTPAEPRSKRQTKNVGHGDRWCDASS